MRDEVGITCGSVTIVVVFRHGVLP